MAIEVYIPLTNTRDNPTWPQFMTVAKVASMLSVSDAFVRRLLRDGLLSGVKLGTAKNSPVRITQESLEHLIESQAMTTPVFTKMETR